MRKGVVLLVLVLLANLSFARTTLISGKAPIHPNKKLTIYTVNDFLTRTKNKVAEITVSNQGTFSFDIDIEKTTYLLMDFGKVKRFMYIEPAENYQVLIDNVSEQILTSESIYATDEQPAHITNKDSSDINELVEDIEGEIALFTLKHKLMLLHAPVKDSIDVFSSYLSRKYPVNKSNFFSLYVEYSLAQLYQLCYKTNKSYFIHSYLLGKTPYSDNPAYMRIFRKQFHKYLSQNPDIDFRNKIYGYINKNNYQSLMDEIYFAEGSSANEFKELLLLYLFYENYGNPHLNPEMVKNLIDKIQTTTKSISNRQVATNILRRIMELTPGSDAPDFALYDVDSNIIQLSNYRGKYVYLTFGESWSRAFEMDVKIMKSWKEKYPEIEIITVLVDEDRMAYETFLAEQVPNWTVLHAGLIPTVSLDYKIKNYPSYFLIDPEGKLIFSPAKSPYEGFEKQYMNYQQK